MPLKKYFVVNFMLTVAMSLFNPAAVVAKTDAKTTSQTKAIRITAENAEQTVQQGPDAIGGIGDWFISNGTLCAVISDVEHESEFSSKGGVLIDLGFCQRADDHLTSTQDLLDGDRKTPMDVYKIQQEVGEHWASVVTYAKQGGTRVVTRYTLSEDKPTQLSISKQLFNTDKSVTDFNIYSTAWFNVRSLETYLYSSNKTGYSRGFQHYDFVTRGVSSISEATSNADTVVLLSPPDAEFPIAYGWQIKSAKRQSSDQSYSVPSFMLSDEESTALLILTDSFYLGDGSKIGILQLPQIPFLSLGDDQLLIEEVIYVGNKPDVAVITDQLIPSGVTVSGQLADINSALHINNLDGDPVTFVRADKDGRFNFKLSKGAYRIIHRGSANRRVERDLVVGASLVTDNAVIDLGKLVLPEAGTLMLPKGEAMRLVFVGINGTADPNFEDRLTGYSVSTDDEVYHSPAIRQLFLAGVDSDQTSVELALGSYRVYATRGPEYSLSATEINIKAGQQIPLKIEPPKHVVDTPGYIAADFHVHSGISFDNTFSTQSRVRTFVAEHGEVMVSSEHDVPVDYAPLISAMGLSDKITSIAAVEMTSLLVSQQYPHTGGHVNFFPVQPSPFAFRKGMINHENRRLRDIISDFKQQHPQSISQLNHARQAFSLSGDLPKDYKQLIHNGAYLEHMGAADHPYNPEQGLHTHPNSRLLEADAVTGLRDLDIEAMEIINPGGSDYPARIEALRKDWLSFLKHGLRITGTANSDSHHSGEQVAVPRNMVAAKGDSVENFDQAELLRAIKQGRVYGTTGPMLNLSLSNDSGRATMGETLTGDRGRLDVSVRSAEWIGAQHIKVQVNGELVIEAALADADKEELSFDLQFEKDSFVTVEVSGQATDEYKIMYPGLSPYAFSNPIYIDANADGEWQAPGLLTDQR